MSDYNWCHGPKCHTYKTQSRIKGVGDNKVLRTRKIKINPNYREVFTITFVIKVVCVIFLQQIQNVSWH
jgi:hypothetical protein